MEKKHTVGLLAIVALLSGLLLRQPATEGTRTEQAAASKESGPVASRRDVEDHLDTLDALADSIGVDVSADGLRRRALRSVRALGKRDGNVHLADEVAFLWTILRQPIRAAGPDVEAARAGLRAFAATHHIPLTSSAPAPKSAGASLRDAESFLTRYLERPAAQPAAGDHARADDFDQLVTTSLKLEVLKQAAASRCIRVRFLIATLPDPVDSYTGWQFDPLLDAMTQAVSASDYTLERFHFPDVDVESGEGHTDSSGSAHEDEPTLVIFRKHTLDGSNERLVLQIVHETPTAGVHARAFARAVRLAARWNDPDPDVCGDLKQPDVACIRILGPTFSGTTESMARGLEMANTALGGRPVWIVSGSATDPSNEGMFARLVANVRYQITVQPDDLLVEKLLGHVALAGWSDTMAVLFEGNTQYGRQILEHVRDLKGVSRFRQVPFPMNISRLRTDARSNQPELDRALGLPSKFRPLSMEQRGTPSDQIPTLFRATSASYLELAVSDMLQSLAREGVRTVALMATDPRDRLYLAQQVARYAPNLSIALVESEALYTHPDYASYLRGALVASTYPLYGGNQRWSGGLQGAVERRQFANGSAQGIYNAALALLNYDQAGHPVPVGEHGHIPSLIEYGPPSHSHPCTVDCRPPVWISVVGRHGLYPVRSYDTDISPTVFAVSNPAPLVESVAGDAPMVFPSPLFTGLCLGLAALSGAGWWVVRKRTASDAWVLSDDDARSSMKWGLTGAWVVSVFAAALCVSRVRVEPTAAAVLMATATVLALLALTDVTRRLFGHRWLRHWRMMPSLLVVRARLTRLAEWRNILGVVMLWGIGNLLVYAWGTTLEAPRDLIGRVARASDLGSGVSPLLPVALLAGGVCLWAAAEFRRARTPRAALNDPAVQELIGFGVHGGTAGMTARWSWFNRPLTAVPSRLQSIAIVTVGATCLAFDPFVRPLVSVEGPLFGRFVSATVLVLQVAACLSLMQFVYLWGALRQLLERLARHAWADAYRRVPQELFPASVFPNVPRVLDLYAVVVRCREHFALLPAPAAIGVHGYSESAELERQYEKDLRTDSNAVWSESPTWKALVSALLRRCRGASVASPAIDSLDQEILSSLTRGDTTREPKALTPPVQDLVAMSMAFVIRDAIARLSQNLVFVIGAAVLVFCSHTLFRFQPHQYLEAFGWTYVAILLTAVVTVLVQMKRNEIISRLASSTPEDRRTWDSAFLLKLLLFGLIPLLTLFAAQFPDVGGIILRWAEPVQKALP